MGSLLAIDAGTTGVTALLIDENGAVVRRGYREFPQYFPQPGWVEHDADEIWAAASQACAEALADGAELDGIGVANQRETAVVWHRETGKPAARAIVWQCRRTAERCEELIEQGLAPRIFQKTGLTIDPYFSAAKLEWTLNHVPEARRSPSRFAFGTVDSWLIWKLTGGRAHLTDMTNASRTMLFNIDAREWDGELLELFGVPRALLPSVQTSSGRFGETRGVGFAPDGVPIRSAVGDQQAALFGQARFKRGEAKNTYGTGCFLLMNAGAERPKGGGRLLTTLACGADGSPVYASEGSVFTAGSTIQWLRDGLGILESAAESEALAVSVEDAGGVAFVPALAGLGAPYWDPHARGAIFGITRGTTRAHIVRAALEGIAHRSADALEAMEQETGARLPQLQVDGGAAANNFLMQTQADLLGVPVNRPAQVETTALGAAYLAGLQTGAWSASDLRSLNPLERRFEPEINPDERAEKRRRWREAVERTLTRRS